MTWDASRPVPWQRLLREGSVFLAIGVIAFALFVKNAQVGSYVGLVIGLGIYVGVSAVMAKFGYTRQSMKEARLSQMERNKERNAARGKGRSDRRRPSSSSSSQPPVGRPKPPPTRRTSTGPSQRPNRKRR